MRPGCVELLFLHSDCGFLDPEVWKFLQLLTVPLGLALIYHSEDDVVHPNSDWIKVRADRCATLLQATGSHLDIVDLTGLPSPRWVLGEPGSFASQWASLINAPGVYPIPYKTFVDGSLPDLEDWRQVPDLQSIDFFSGMDPEDPTGEEVVSRLVAFVQALVSSRVKKATDLCRFTVVTHKAAFEVRKTPAEPGFGGRCEVWPRK